MPKIDGGGWKRASGVVAAIVFVVCLKGQLASAADEPASGSARSAAAETRWNWHGQSTFVWQGHGPMRSPYATENSLHPGGQGRETISMTGSVGLRLWTGGEFYVNPELFQGFGLARTHGLGGFSNGEAQKGGSLEPQYYVSRAFYRHTFGFGGETEKVEDDFNQLPGERDVSRLTVTIGRFAVNDIFDGNAYGKDPRTQFLNYALWAQGAFDFGADQRGYGGGVVLDFNQKHWAVRAGYVLVPVHPNAQALSFDLLRQGQYVAELELKWSLATGPGAVRALGWTSRGIAGSYREAIADPDFDAEQSVQRTWRVRSQYGYGFSFDQALSKDLGVFARWSWRDAQSEITSWADMDRSLAAGLSLKGRAWGRPDDVVGLGAVVNGLSAVHADYFAAGGFGVTVGDGRIDYATERILEGYYAFGFGPTRSLTFDYQYIVNPAYNADRGPVSIFAARLHGHF